MTTDTQQTQELTAAGSQGSRDYTVIYQDGEYLAIVGEMRNGEMHYVSCSFRSLRGAELFIKSVLSQSVVR